MLLENEGLSAVTDVDGSIKSRESALVRPPEVILSDRVYDDGTTALELLAKLRERGATTRMILLSASAQDDEIVTAIRGGVNAYLLKETPIPELVMAVYAVAAGGSWLSPSITTSIFSYISSGNIPSVGGPRALSGRELQVLELLAQGLDNNQVAEQLNISAKTVKNHVSNLFEKLGVVNRVQAAVYAVRSGIA